MSSLHAAALPALALTLVLGCARETRVTDPSSVEVPFHSGSLDGATSGRLGPAQTTTSSGATLTGLVGTFTSLTAGGPAAGSVATVYFTSSFPGSPARLWQVRTDGTGLRQVLPDSVPGFSPSVSPSGKRLLFWVPAASDTAPGPPARHLVELAADGTFPRLTTEVDAHAVSWTPDEAAVIYPLLILDNPYPRVIRLLPLDGSGPRDLLRVVPDTFMSLRDRRLTVGQVNGRTVVIHEDVLGHGLNLLDVLTGIDAPYLTPADSEDIRSPDLSQDGRIAFMVTRPAGNGIYRSQLKVADVNHPEAAIALPFTKDSRDNYADRMRWLQDGSGMVVLANALPYGSQLVLIDAQGTFMRQLTSRPHIPLEEFSVGPSSPASLALVGDGGVLGTTASGIIFGQPRSGGLSGVVAFQSDQPRSVTLIANTGLNATGPALTYTLTAERLRTLRFINSPPGGTVITVVDSTLPAAGGALINFDADQGAVTLVLPFAEGRSAGATVTESDGTRIFQGTFLGAWTGRTNLAPHGATEVRLEMATGRMEVIP
jgi:hypothetical protein